jgi:hypothetical protein
MRESAIANLSYQHGVYSLKICNTDVRDELPVTSEVYDLRDQI